MKESAPLNDEQRKFATENHSLVFAFLNENHLPEDEYYDVVIFGYLQAVADYFNQQNLKRYSFSTLAWKRMNRHFFNYTKSQNAPKRHTKTVSIHSKADDSMLTWEETLAATDDCMAELETELLLHDLALRLPRRQMSVIRMKVDGYGVRDIARREDIGIRTVHAILDDAYDVVVAICGR
ncbi:MAG: sigma-70 family RNA polymerase sigma factor [Oscillospiraceae bacterium]|nr:sigma-70 family RNA polymerase sigma factor [Oscillospiraceae bacterium]